MFDDKPHVKCSNPGLRGYHTSSPIIFSLPFRRVADVATDRRGKLCCRLEACNRPGSWEQTDVACYFQISRMIEEATVFTVQKGGSRVRSETKLADIWFVASTRFSLGVRMEVKENETTHQAKIQIIV